MTSCDVAGSETVPDAVPFDDISSALPPEAVESEYRLLPEVVVSDSPSMTTSPLAMVAAAIGLDAADLTAAAGAAVAETAESGVVGTVTELRCVESGFVNANPNIESAFGVCVGPVGVVPCVLEDITGVTVREGTPDGSAAAGLEMLAEAGGVLLVAAEIVAAGEAVLVDSAAVRVGPPALDDVIVVPPDTVAAADGMADLDTADDGFRGVREPLVEFEADDRVAEAVEELLAELSAEAVAALMMPTAVPMPSSTASAPTRPTFTA